MPGIIAQVWQLFRLRVGAFAASASARSIACFSVAISQPPAAVRRELAVAAAASVPRPATAQTVSVGSYRRLPPPSRPAAPAPLLLPSTARRYACKVVVALIDGRWRDAWSRPANPDTPGNIAARAPRGNRDPPRPARRDPPDADVTHSIAPRTREISYCRAWRATTGPSTDLRLDWLKRELDRTAGSPPADCTTSAAAS